MTCKNCGNEFEGKFCNNCGQKALQHGFTVKHILHDFFHSFTHIDSGLLFLIREMFLRPGIVVKEYIGGKRKKYFNPMQYLVLGVAVSFFLTVKLGVIGYNHLAPEVYARLPYWQAFSLKYNNFVYTYFNLMLFIGVPVMAFYSYLFYKKSKNNFAENLVLQTFLSGQRSLIYILLMPLMYGLRQKWYIGLGAYYFIIFIYFAWAYIQFFGGNKIVNILKFTASFILSLITIQGISLAVFYLFFFTL